MKKFREFIAKKIAPLASLSEIEAMLEKPKETAHGDFSFPCFALAKALKKPPQTIAKELAAQIKQESPIKKIEVIGAYINFFIEDEKYIEEIFEQMKNKDFGKPKMKKEKVMIEFCQANTHKPFHIGHFRNLSLGDSLVRLWKFAGNEVIAANYPGDVGAHVAKCLWGLKKFHANETPPEKHRGEWLGLIYAEANEKIESNPDYKAEVSEILRKLESGDKELTKLWNETRQWCLDEFNEIYDEINVNFDVFFFESEVEKPGKILVQEMLKKGIAKESDGAIIVDLEKYKLDVFVILKSDGTSLYSTKDLALAKQKFEQFGVERSIHVVGSEQKFYFRQLFKTLELMGFKHAKDCYHLSYELVMLPKGKMSSRAGNVVIFRLVYEEVLAKALEEVNKRHPEWDENKKNLTAKGIALAAMKFSMLNQDNNKTIIFDMDKALEFEGETGPYIQYVIARINSIIRKHSGKIPHNPALSVFKDPSEIRLIKLLGDFPEIIEEATLSYRPMSLCKYLIDVSQSFNDFYNRCPVLKAEQNEKIARLYLIEKTKEILSEGLSLLGIPVLEEM
ncbi:MAG TPA: arginine--tRNA ligase [Candidatus Nanoarchaeia archaeon]|nr:arginine--tRNA ligase [Candidatus Nanoarchaeia archaeon]